MLVLEAAVYFGRIISHIVSINLVLICYCFKVTLCY